MAQNGRYILIKMNGTLIAGTRANEASTDVDAIETANPSSGAWRNYVAGRKGWSMSTNFLVPNKDDIDFLLKAGTIVTLVFCHKNGTIGLTGSAIVKSCKTTVTIGNLAQGSYSFLGIGELVQVRLQP